VHVTIVRELVYVLAVNLQLLASYCILWSAVCPTRLRCLYAAGAKGVEEAVLACGGVRCERGWWTSVLFLEIVPLLQSALPLHKP
jgi:hypothetical protein